MLLLLFIAAGAYVLYRRSDPSDFGPGLQELALAEDGSFVLVESLPQPTPDRPEAAPESQAQHPGTSVGHAAPGMNCFPNVSVGCAPGRDCCADCRKGKVEVGYLAPGQSAVSVGEVHQLVAALAQRIAGGDPDAVRRAEAIFSMALEKGDLRARFVAEEITRAMDHYAPWRGIDDPNIRLR